MLSNKNVKEYCNYKMLSTKNGKEYCKYICYKLKMVIIIANLKFEQIIRGIIKISIIKMLINIIINTNKLTLY